MNESDVQNTKINVIDSSQLATLRGMQKPGRCQGNSARGSSLKGSSASMGATQMVALYQELEQEGQAKRNTEVLLARLDHEFELVCAALKAERRETEG